MNVAFDGSGEKKESNAKLDFPGHFRAAFAVVAMYFFLQKTCLNFLLLRVPFGIYVARENNSEH